MPAHLVPSQAVYPALTPFSLPLPFPMCLLLLPSDLPYACHRILPILGGGTCLYYSLPYLPLPLCLYCVCAFPLFWEDGRTLPTFTCACTMPAFATAPSSLLFGFLALPFALPLCLHTYTPSFPHWLSPPSAVYLLPMPHVPGCSRLCLCLYLIMPDSIPFPTFVGFLPRTYPLACLVPTYRSPHLLQPRLPILHAFVALYYPAPGPALALCSHYVPYGTDLDLCSHPLPIATTHTTVPHIPTFLGLVPHLHSCNVSHCTTLPSHLPPTYHLVPWLPLKFPWILG